jgi:hypothetical protein
MQCNCIAAMLCYVCMYVFMYVYLYTYSYNSLYIYIYIYAVFIMIDMYPLSTYFGIIQSFTHVT